MTDRADSESSASESDPLYPPPPPGYYRRGEPTRVTDYAALVAVLMAVAFACAAVAALIDVSIPPPGGAHIGRSQQEVADQVLGAMDRSADPCEDMYEFACGSWLRANYIPADRSTYQKSFTGTYDRILLQVRSVLEEGVRAGSTNAAVVLYSSCLDQSSLGGMKTPLLYAFKELIAGIVDGPSFARAVGELHAKMSAAMFDFYVDVDEGTPDQYALYLSQGGLGLPHRDDYSSTSERASRVRAAYLAEMEIMLSAAARAKLVPKYGLAALAAKVLEFENALAAATKPPAALRDPFKTYNPRKLWDLPKGLSIHAYLEGAGVAIADIGGDGNATVVLDSPEYFDSVATMIERVGSDVDWMRTARAYVLFHLVRRHASMGTLGEQLYQAHFKFTKLVFGTVSPLHPSHPHALPRRRHQSLTHSAFPTTPQG